MFRNFLFLNEWEALENLCTCRLSSGKIDDKTAIIFFFFFSLRWLKARESLLTMSTRSIHFHWKPILSKPLNDYFKPQLDWTLSIFQFHRNQSKILNISLSFFLWVYHFENRVIFYLFVRYIVLEAKSYIIQLAFEIITSVSHV